MVPPQVSPISHASSSPRFSSRSRGSCAASTEADSSMTWASTQPPMVTEPSTRPSSPTSILAPSLRGVVPRVLTSVATATLPSALRSRSRFSKSSLMFRASSYGQVAGELAQARQVVRGGEVIDERKGGGHAARERLVGRVAQERVEPDHAPGPSLERQHLLGQHLGLPRVPAIREDQHDGPPIHEVTPFPVEVPKRVADPGPPRPVAHLGQAPERALVGGPAQ